MAYDINNLVKLQYKFTDGDEISYYETIKFQKLTVSDYIEAIINQASEWGYIDLFDYDTNKEERLEYSHGTRLNDISNEWLDKMVTKIQYCGGWSRGDWRIVIGDESNFKI